MQSKIGRPMLDAERRGALLVQAYVTELRPGRETDTEQVVADMIVDLLDYAIGGMGIDVQEIGEKLTPADAALVRAVGVSTRGRAA